MPLVFDLFPMERKTRFLFLDLRGDESQERIASIRVLEERFPCRTSGFLCFTLGIMREGKVYHKLTSSYSYLFVVPFQGEETWESERTIDGMMAWESKTMISLVLNRSAPMIGH